MVLSPTATPVSQPAVHEGVQRTYYSISEVAALLGVSRVSVWRWISSGRLTVSRLGHRTVRIHAEDVDRIVQSGRPRLEMRTGQAARAVWPSLEASEHIVMFYEADEFLADSVAEFIGPALKAGGQGVVIATAAHRAAIAERLARSGIDVERAARAGRFVAEDAQTTLKRFLFDNSLDGAVFEQVVDELAGGATSGKVRIYGEMVALLVANGQPHTALALEAMWNRAQQTRTFSLLCGYPLRQFGGQAMAPLLTDACTAHSQVVPSERYSRLADEQDRLREIAALQQKAESLEAALRVRDEFLSTAAHELRNPLAVLGLQAQMCLRQFERKGALEPERAVKGLQAINTQTDKLARLIEQLLDISRLDSGKLVIDRQPTDLAALVEHVVATSRALSGGRTIRLKVHAASSLACEVDALRIEQVLMNLIDNAVKYSPETSPIEVALREVGPDGMELCVRDYGPGIEPSKRARIFERFFQAHDTASSSRTGLGLGLYLCRTIVELHGGTISAEFPADGGTRFVLQLPKML